MVRAGYKNPGRAAAIYAVTELLSPLFFAAVTLGALGVRRGGLYALLAAAVGYALPGFILARQTANRQKQIQNGLPDALDLLIVCVEAGAGLDSAIVKASEELVLAYPALAEELKLITTETRAGKPRLEAFRNFAQRTGVDDVRSLVAMLVQTDRFGTSIAQALRTHAATARTKRRQRAEERAAKLGVKLVFPLVFCLFPALYVVVLGPAVIKIMHSLLGK
jgi:tight adherence protein C